VVYNFVGSPDCFHVRVRGAMGLHYEYYKMWGVSHPGL